MFRKIVAAAFVVGGSMGVANAAAISSLEVSFTEVLTFGSTIVAALVTLIPLRKAIKTANRS